MTGSTSTGLVPANGVTLHAKPLDETVLAGYEFTAAHSDGITSTLGIPESIQIGHVRYTVANDSQAYAEATEANNETLWGRIEYAKSRIVLNPFQDRQHERESLFHEMLHGVWHMTDPHNRNDEAVILRLAGPLLDTLRRNPQLIRYLLED